MNKENTLSYLSSFFLHILVAITIIGFVPIKPLPPKEIKFLEVSFVQPPAPKKVEAKQQTKTVAISKPQPIEPKKQPIVKKIVQKPLPQKQIVKKAPAKPVQKIVPKQEYIPKPATNQIATSQQTPSKPIQNNYTPSTTSNNNHSKAPTSNVQQAAKPVTKSTAPSTVNQQGAINAYAAQARNIMERNKRYPRSAERRGITGNVSVRVNVHKSGRILSKHISSSSGNNMLDQAALDAVHASSLPSFPTTITVAQLTLQINFVFRGR